MEMKLEKDGDGVIVRMKPRPDDYPIFIMSSVPKPLPGATVIDSDQCFRPTTLKEFPEEVFRKS